MDSVKIARNRKAKEKYRQARKASMYSKTVKYGMSKEAAKYVINYVRPPDLNMRLPKIC